MLQSATLVLDFPPPPSINRVWRSGKSRAGKVFVYRNPTYVRWIQEFWGHWCESKPSGFKTIKGEFECEILVCPKRKRDADASAKAVLDAAQAVGIIHNDSQARKVVQELVDKTRAPLGCRLVITPISSEWDAMWAKPFHRQDMI